MENFLMPLPRRPRVHLLRRCRPRLSAPPELLGEGRVFSRVGASRPGNSEFEGAPAVGELPGGLVRKVVLDKMDFAGNLVSPLVGGVHFAGAGGLEAVLRTSDALVVLEVQGAGARPSDHRCDCGGGRRGKTSCLLHRASPLQRQVPQCRCKIASLQRARSAVWPGRRRAGRHRRSGDISRCCCCGCCCRCWRRRCHRVISHRDRRRRRRCHPHRRLPGWVVLTEVLLDRPERTMSLADEGTLRAAPFNLGSGVKLL